MSVTCLNLSRYFKNQDIMDVLIDTGSFVMNVRSQAMLNKEIKDKEELVSFADRKAQDIIVRGLRPIFSNALFVAEETNQIETKHTILSGKTADWTWVIDPIDGTEGYLSGNDQFAIQVSLVSKGNMIAGFIYCPSNGKSVMGNIEGDVICSGLDEVVDRNPIVLSEMNMVLAAGDFDSAHRERSQALATQTAFHRKTRSCAIDYLEVVEGKIDLLAYRRTRPWDHAPGAFLVQQSGGLAERYNGRSYQPFDESEGIVVCRKKEFQNEMRQFTP